jgi:hypothetical protein
MALSLAFSVTQDRGCVEGRKGGANGRGMGEERGEG